MYGAKLVALATVALLSAALTTQSHAQIAFRSASSAATYLAGFSTAFVASGTAASATNGNVTPGLPSGWEPSDIFLCVIESLDNAQATMPGGWTLLNEGSGSSGTHQATLFWKRAAPGDTDPVVTHSASGGRIIARIHAFRSVDMTTPFDVANSFTSNTASTVSAADAVTTVTGGALLVYTAHLAAANTLSGTPSGSTPWTFAGASSSGGSGDGVAIGLWYGARASAGAQAAVQTSHADSVESHGAQIALRHSSTFTLAKPAGTAANDVMVASIGIYAGSTSSLTAPAGWTAVSLQDNPGSSPYALAVYVKTAGSGEPAQYTWTLGASATARGVAGGIQSFSGVDTTNPIDVEGGQLTSSSLTHATPSVTTSAANAMLVASHAFLSSSSWSPPSGMTEGVDVASRVPPNTSGVTLETSYVLQAAAGASGGKTATAAANADVGATHLLALRPAGGPPPAASNIYYIFPDHLNTPRLITNQSQQAVWRMDHGEPFGKDPANDNPSGLGAFEFNLRFPGQYFDKETNTHYNNFRDYDPAIGRYVQSDPIGLAGGVNIYLYADGNPIGVTDFEGLQNKGNLPNKATQNIPLGSASGGGGFGSFYRNLGSAPPRTASFPVGSSRSQFQVPPRAQQPSGQACGRDYSGHAFDQMQARGIPPSVVNDTIATGSWYPGNTPSTSQYFSAVNNVTVIVNQNTGNTVTVRWGPPSALGGNGGAQ